MNDLSKKSYITLHVFYLPILVAVLVVSALGAGTLALSTGRTTQDKNAVLSDEDDRSEDEDTEDNKEEDSNDDEDKDDREDSKEESKREEQKIEVRTTGTTTKLRIEQREKEEENDNDDNDQEDEDEDDNDESENELEIEDEDESTESDNSEDDKDSNKFELEFEQDSDGAEGTIFSNIMKAKLKQEVENEGDLGKNVNKVKLEVKTSQGTLKYEGTALKDEKLFGIFGVQVPIDLEVDPTTGKIISVNQSFWSKILDFFSL